MSQSAYGATTPPPGPSPYFRYIQRYFPEAEWDNANCITWRECTWGSPTYPNCIADEGYLRCNENAPYVNARSWGVFQLLDACYDPDINPSSPFTREIWAQRLDPNVNTWMASKLWSAYGWRYWSTAAPCELANSVGGVIPYPRGPVYDDEPCIFDCEPPLLVSVSIVPLVLGVGMIGLAAHLVLKKR